MRTRYGVRKILPQDDYAATELVVLAVRELLYERAATEHVAWQSLRVSVETTRLGDDERLIAYARVDTLSD